MDAIAIRAQSLVPAAQYVGWDNPLPGAGLFAAVGGTLVRPSNTTAYASGKIIAQSTVAGSCSAILIAASRANDATGMIRRLRLKVNDAAWVAATVRVHLFKDAPTFTNGDGGNFAAGLTESNYLGYLDVLLDQSFSDPFAKGFASGEINYEPSLGTPNIFAVFEARSAVTPAASKTFSLTAEVLRN